MQKNVKKLMPFPPAHYYSGRQRSEGANEFDREAKKTHRTGQNVKRVEVELTPKKIPWGMKRSTNIRQLPSSGPRARERAKWSGGGVRMRDEKKNTARKKFICFYQFFCTLRAASSNFLPPSHSPQRRRPQHCFLLCPLCAYMLTYFDVCIYVTGRKNSGLFAI